MTVRNRALFALAIFLLALVPRALPVTVYTDDEEKHWPMRSLIFLRALERGDWQGTVITHHPGVLTMHTGAVGLLAAQEISGKWAEELDLIAWLPVIRLPAILLNTLCVALAYALLLPRLFGERAALLGALIWAFEPLLVAHSRILHIDALTTSFATLSILAGLVAFRYDDDPSVGRVRWGWLIFSAVCCGLAALAKFTLFYMAAPLGLAGLIPRYRNWRRWPLSVILPMVVWGLLAVGAWVAFYPGAWTNISGIAERLQFGVGVALSPHESGNYFWGAPIADPGALFYAVAVPLRLTPWTSVGVLLGLFAITRPALRSRRWTTLALMIYVVGFLLLMATQPKKFDRYALPTFPALGFIAAMGLAWAVSRVKIGPRWAGWAAVTVAFAANAAWYFPHELAYYNPLLGGGRAADFVLPVGWGEGLDAAAAYIITDLTDDCTQRIDLMNEYSRYLRHYLPADCVTMTRFRDDYASSDYALVYINQRQREPAEVADVLANETLHHTVRIHGVAYAHIYRLGDEGRALR